MNFKVLISAIFASVLALVGCDSSSSGGGGTGGDPWVPIEDCETAIQTPAGYSIEGAPDTATDDCTTTVSASGENDAAKINEAVELESSNGVICLEAGEYDMEGSVFVTDAQNLTIKGIGDEVDDVKLDFKGRGDRGFDVTADGFKIENMWIVNTASNGVEVKAADSIFRKLYVTWDAGSVPENGAYAAYPTKCSNTLVEYVEVTGASDAGLYVGQCVGGIVRYNKVHANVAGLEVENSKDIEVYGNEVYDNSGGLLALQEPGLDRLKNENVLMRDNFVYCNNHDNFARPGTTVADIPVGTGTMSLSGIDIEFQGNIMDSNWSTGFLLVSNVIFCQFANQDCDAEPGYNNYPENIYIHDNIYINNGTDPQDLVLDIATLTGIPTPEVIWDGYINPDTTDPNICLGDPVVPTFINLTQNNCQVDDMGDPIPGDKLTLCVAGNFTKDTTGVDCTLDPIVP